MPTSSARACPSAVVPSKAPAHSWWKHDSREATARGALPCYPSGRPPCGLLLPPVGTDVARYPPPASKAGPRPAPAPSAPCSSPSSPSADSRSQVSQAPASPVRRPSPHARRLTSQHRRWPSSSRPSLPSPRHHRTLAACDAQRCATPVGCRTSSLYIGEGVGRAFAGSETSPHATRMKIRTCARKGEVVGVCLNAISRAVLERTPRGEETLKR